MGIVFDEVVGTVTPGDGAEPRGFEQREDTPPPAPALDRARIERELCAIRRRDARLHAD